MDLIYFWTQVVWDHLHMDYYKSDHLPMIDPVKPACYHVLFSNLCICAWEGEAALQLPVLQPRSIAY